MTIYALGADTPQIHEDCWVAPDANLIGKVVLEESSSCLLYTSPSPRDLSTSRMPSSA